MERDEFIKDINSSPYKGYGIGNADFESVENPPLYRECKNKASIEERRECTNKRVINFFTNNIDMEYINITIPEQRLWDVDLHFNILSDGKVEKSNFGFRGAPKSIINELSRIIKIIPDFENGGTEKGRKVTTRYRLNMKIQTLSKD